MFKEFYGNKDDDYLSEFRQKIASERQAELQARKQELQRSRNGFIGTIAGIALAGIVSWLLLIPRFNEDKNVEIPVIRRPTNPVKIHPSNPQGMQIQNQDKSIYALVEKQEADTVKIESILPAPEKPKLPEIVPEPEVKTEPEIHEEETIQEKQDVLPIKNLEELIETVETTEAKKIENVICGEHQVKLEDPKLYYSSFFGKNFVDESRATDMLSGTGKRLEIYITENLEGFLAKLDIRSDGSLSISDVDKGSYINLNEYDFTDAVNVEDKYVDLFDRTVDLILESSYINDEDKEKLSSLNDSDKKVIIAKIIEYQDLGATNVKVYKSNWFWRIALTIIAGIYLWIVGFVHKEDGLPEFYELSNNNGELVESEHKKNLGLFYLGVKYKEAFLAAERDRVQRIYDLCDENLVSSSRDKVLTSYEKKLIKK